MIFKKICLFFLEGKIYLPPTLSSQAQDLLKCMLNVDPVQRIKLHDIRSHPWVLMHTEPRDTLVETISKDLLDEMSEIDEVLLDQILAFKFNFGNLDINGIIQAIQEKRSDDFAVAYNLLKNQKYKSSLEEFINKITCSNFFFF